MSNNDAVARTEDEFLEMFVQSMDADDIRLIDSLLRAKCKDPRFPLDINKCAIAVAARGRADVLTKVLTLGPKMSYGDGEGRRAIHHAASNGNVECARLLLKAGAISNCADLQGKTPLHLACLMGHTDIVHLLVRQCAHINSCRTQTGENAVHVTAAAGHLSVMEVLMDNGGDAGLVTHQSKGGETPLHKAVGADKPQMVELLCNHGANPDHPDAWGKFPIHLASERGLLRCLSVLIRHGASLETRDGQGQTALGVAIVEGQAQAARALLDCGADVCVEDRHCFTLLHKAAMRDNNDLIEMLVEAGADVNMRAQDSLQSPLMSAVSMGRLKAVRKLIELGADVTLPDRYGNTPLHLVHFKLGGEPPKDIILALLEGGGRLDPRDRGQLTPLQRCLEVGVIRRNPSLACVRLLCEAGSHLGPDSFNHGFKSPLFRQAYTGCLHEALYLGRAGWDLRQEPWLSLPGKNGRQDRLHQMLLDIRNRMPSLLSCCRKVRRHLK
ncbi:ankyrin repeat domain-containing protein [Plakobranchus ocellatus]|uniref:Ankyrin repeat domain-containing protein n=1 Tax=Plakobranchus ocellatus TaxID=259542 RepID=A0AAV4CH04_9GAST|nr:ankyrin repeat domain-containing protein [Plakobranchus ocellatus]